MNLAAVRGSFRLEPSALVVGVLRGLGFLALIAFHLSEQQIAYVRRLIYGAGALCHDTSFGDFRHQRQTESSGSSSVRVRMVVTASSPVPCRMFHARPSFHQVTA